MIIVSENRFSGKTYFYTIGSRLATLATMPFLITYAVIEYAYFVLCMQFDINQQRLQKFRYKWDL